MNFIQSTTLKRLREKLSETISRTKTVSGPTGHYVVTDDTGAVLNGRTGTFDRNLADAYP